MTSRHINWNNTRDPASHMVRQLIKESPLTYLLVRYSHMAVGCMKSIAKYKDNIQLGGFTAKNIDQIIFDFKAEFQRCPMLQQVMNLKMPAV